jgi:hypothetical protein
MKTIKMVAVIAFVCSGLIAHNFAALHADELFSQTLKPMQGITFTLGAKPALVYFNRSKRRCDAVLMTASKLDWINKPQIFETTKFEATIADGKTIRFAPVPERALELGCHSGGQAMSVKPVDRVAIDAKP